MLASHPVPPPNVTVKAASSITHRRISPALYPILRWKPLVREAWPGHSSLVLAVIAQESWGIPNTYVEDPNTSWDAGLMGINSTNWPTFNLDWETASQPGPNIAAGVTMLKQDIREYGRWEGLSVYNSGSPFGNPAYATAVIRWQETIRKAEEGVR